MDVIRKLPARLGTRRRQAPLASPLSFARVARAPIRFGAMSSLGRVFERGAHDELMVARGRHFELCACNRVGDE